MKNYFYNLSYQILVVLTPFITIPYLARVLGPESIGLASFSSSIVSYFSLFASLGIGLPTGRTTPRAAARRFLS